MNTISERITEENLRLFSTQRLVDELRRREFSVSLFYGSIPRFEKTSQDENNNIKITPRLLADYEIRFLKLIERDKQPVDSENCEAELLGWTKVSSAVFPLLKKLPSELVILEQLSEEEVKRTGWEAKAKLSCLGKQVFDVMAYFGR